MPIIIIDLVSVELLCNLSESIYNLFNWSYRIHVFGGGHTHTNVTDKSNFKTPDAHTWFNKCVTSLTLIDTFGAKMFKKWKQGTCSSEYYLPSLQ